MSDSEKRRGRQKIGSPNSDKGFGKPPIEHQFKEGGPNPSKGRRRGSKNKRKIDAPNIIFLDAALEHSLELIDVNIQGVACKLPRRAVVLSAMFNNGVKGNARSAEDYAKLCERADAMRDKNIDLLIKTIADYRSCTMEEIHYRESVGRSYNDLLPHPDHVSFDLLTNNLRVCGPGTPKEKEFWDAVERRRDGLIEKRDRLRLRKAETNEDKERLAVLSKNNQSWIDLMSWWIDTYDGLCRGGHTQEGLKRAFDTFFPEGRAPKSLFEDGKGSK